MKRLQCWLKGHDFRPFASMNFGSRAKEIPSWLYQCSRCGHVHVGILFAPAPWPPLEPMKTVRFRHRGRILVYDVPASSWHEGELPPPPPVDMLGEDFGIERAI